MESGMTVCASPTRRTQISPPCAYWHVSGHRHTHDACSQALTGGGTTCCGGPYRFTGGWGRELGVGSMLREGGGGMRSRRGLVRTGTPRIRAQLETERPGSNVRRRS
ncbi:hypothetical protein VUR80DRAFT_1002 [Thermomyces stellatus]